jgi:hypothetical protein
LYNILICYYGDYPTRTTIIDHLYSFQRYSGQRCFYLDLAAQKVPGHLLRIPFALIIFHTKFLSARWDLETFNRIVDKVRPFKRNPAVKVAIPQDEFYSTNVVCDFINEFEIEHVFSVSPPSEWRKIYRTVDFSKVKFHEVLTGYLEERTLKRIDRMAKAALDRDLDIGYRAWRAEPWLGRHGLLKTQLAEVFLQASAARDIKVDISTRAEDTLHGDAWYEFLFRCKYTIGVEGGASILDWDGSVRERTNQYVAQHPRENFEQVEAACFPGQDGSLSLFAISPRHLEACATMTCQVLVEGGYNGVLTAGRHYIEVKRDFSNLEDVFSQLKDDALRMTIAKNAYNQVVASGNYLYQSFVRQVLDISLGTVTEKTALQTRWTDWLPWRFAQGMNMFAWVKLAFKGLILYPLYQKAFDVLPVSIASPIRTVARKVLKK